jgi:hypothetical protein
MELSILLYVFELSSFKLAIIINEMFRDVMQMKTKICRLAKTLPIMEFCIDVIVLEVLFNRHNSV